MTQIFKSMLFINLTNYIISRQCHDHNTLFAVTGTIIIIQTFLQHEYNIDGQNLYNVIVSNTLYIYKQTTNTIINKCLPCKDK